MYRNASHCSTNGSPAQRMFGRQLLTRLEYVKPTSLKSAEEPKPAVKTANKGRAVNFSVREEVMVRDYRNQESIEWTTVVVKKKVGRVTYLYQV